MTRKNQIYHFYNFLVFQHPSYKQIKFKNKKVLTEIMSIRDSKSSICVAIDL